MITFNVVFTAIAALILNTSALCGPVSSIEPAPPPAPIQTEHSPEPTSTPVAAVSGLPAARTTAGTKAVVKPSESFDAASFENSASITNPWLPLKPGMRYTYEGKSVDDNGNLLPHRIVVNVTDLTKVIGGVRSLITWDQDYSADTLAESELAFYAQDKGGNVWYMGEHPEVYENGKFVEAPTWIAGIDGAKAGIMMKANPQVGTPSYPEGWGPSVDWTDRGQVDQMGQKTCVPVGCYEGVLVIAETSQSEPAAQQLKYYARGVGNVRVGWKGAGEKTKETLELVKLEQLSPKAMAQVRVEALKLEQHAYKVSKGVYAKTPPAEPATPAR